MFEIVNYGIYYFIIRNPLLLSLPLVLVLNSTLCDINIDISPFV